MRQVESTEGGEGVIEIVRKRKRKRKWRYRYRFTWIREMNKDRYI